MKIIVTHISPDLDAIVSAWLILNYFPEWKNASIIFVPPGETFENKPPDDNPNIIHIDTGKGKFDHHQSNSYTCSAEKILKHLNGNKYCNNKHFIILKRIVEAVCDFDHFAEARILNACDDIYDFLLPSLLSGLKITYHNDEIFIQNSFILIDALFEVFQKKIYAELDIEQGFEFTSFWGKTIAIESNNPIVSRISQRKNYNLVLFRSKTQKFIRITLNPKSKKDLKKLYILLKKSDSKASWYYHISGHMIINGLQSKTNMIISSLSLQDMIKLVKTV